jgi:hypothetical protein
MAERVGFEPTDRLPGQWFSRSLGLNEPEHSATRKNNGFKHLASRALFLESALIREAIRRPLKIED